MASFFVLDIASFAQYQYAWYEATDTARYSDDFPTCPSCGGPIGSRVWLPPRQVVLKQSRLIADLTGGTGPTFLASEEFLTSWQAENLVGIERSYEVIVVRMGTTTKARRLVPPRLWGVDVTHSPTRLVHSAMGIRWFTEPGTDYCRTCGPGGGGVNGIIQSRSCIVVDENSWCGEDMFYPMSLPGTILLSERGADFIRSRGFTNARITAAEDAAHSIFPVGVAQGDEL